MPNPKIERYEEDTYLELEEFDYSLRNLNVKKISKTKYAHLCDLDKEFYDRFNRIASN